MGDPKKEELTEFSVEADWMVSGTVIVKARNAAEAKRLADDVPLDKFDTNWIGDSFNVRCVTNLATGKEFEEAS